MRCWARIYKWIEASGPGSYLSYLRESKPNIPYGSTILYIVYGPDLVLSVLIGIVFYYVIGSDPELINRIRANFGNLLTLSGMFFGFCMTSLTFFVQAASSWKRSESIDNLGCLAVELHVWSLMTWMLIVIYTLFLWAWGRPSGVGTALVAAYAVLVAFVAYGLLQLLSQVLELTVLFHRRDAVQKNE